MISVMDRPYPTSCDCTSGHHPLGAAHGWVQCNTCGLIQYAPGVENAERYPLPAKTRHTLRENWHMRQPGGGVTSGHLVVITHLDNGPEPIYHVNHLKEVARQLERGASLVEIWQVAADGGSKLIEAHYPPWLLRLLDTRRRRPSALTLACCNA
jgi:hypothetical protein